MKVINHATITPKGYKIEPEPTIDVNDFRGVTGDAKRYINSIVADFIKECNKDGYSDLIMTGSGQL